jgi:hypothetical protein
MSREEWLAKPIGEEMEARIRTAMRIEENGVIPDRAILLYWEIACICQRMHRPVSETELMLMAILMKVGLEDIEPDTFADFIRKEGPPAGVRVLAKYQSRWRWGKYLKLDSAEKKIHVELDDDKADFRRFAYTSVRLPTDEEREACGE